MARVRMSGDADTDVMASSLAALAMVVTAGPAWAGGDVAEIFRGRAGAYHPGCPAGGARTFTSRSSDAETSQPITDAEVVLVAVDESGKPEYQSRALNTPADPRLRLQHHLRGRLLDDSC